MGLVHFLGDRSAPAMVGPIFGTQEVCHELKRWVSWRSCCLAAPPAAQGSGILLKGWHAGVNWHGKFASRLFQILQCLANKSEQSALSASCYVTQLETGVYKIHLEVRHPVPKTKECFSRAFQKCICFIKGPIVSSLKQVYPSGISCSARIEKTTTLHFHSKLLLPAEMYWEAAEETGRLSAQETEGGRSLETGPKRSIYKCQFDLTLEHMDVF